MGEPIYLAKQIPVKKIHVEDVNQNEKKDNPNQK
jgi:hypothetical protein